MIEPRIRSDRVTVYEADCLEVLPQLPAESVDSVVTDPPYGLEFMGQDWDGADGFRRSLNAADVGRDSVFGRTSAKAPEYRTSGAGQKTKPGLGERPTEWVNNQGWNAWRCEHCGHLGHGGSPCQCDQPRMVRADNRWNVYQDWCYAWAVECLRVLKPGGYLLAFGGTRTWHRLATAIEDAGFEIRDNIAWIYGSGFPKSLDVSKAIDKAAGAEREVVGTKIGRPGYSLAENKVGGGRAVYSEFTSADSECAITTPATDEATQWEGWGTALKPAHEPVVVARKPLAGTVAQNVVAYGTGALNIDACRVATTDADKAAINAKHAGMQVDEYERPAGTVLNLSVNPMPLIAAHAHDAGRWPPNVVLDDSQAAELDQQSGIGKDGIAVQRNGGGQALFGGIAGNEGSGEKRADVGYGGAGGASRFFPVFRYQAKASSRERPTADGVSHPTVKPLALMRWLTRLVTPPDGIVLDPFFGSGTSAEACLLEGLRCIGIERDPRYIPLTRTRLGLLIPNGDVA